MIPTGMYLEKCKQPISYKTRCEAQCDGKLFCEVVVPALDKAAHIAQKRQ